MQGERAHFLRLRLGEHFSEFRIIRRCYAVDRQHVIADLHANVVRRRFYSNPVVSADPTNQLTLLHRLDDERSVSSLGERRNAESKIALVALVLGSDVEHEHVGDLDGRVVGGRLLGRVEVERVGGQWEATGRHDEECWWWWVRED